MSTFPGAIPSYQGFISGDTLKNDNHGAQHNAEQGDISALASKVGTGASTPTSGLLLRGSGAGTSAWSQVILTSDVSGVLPQANGGTGTTLATGTGKTVYDTSPTISGASLTGSPTITTPTIASFVNANHDHSNSTNGGSLGAGVVAFSNLLGTIFSGQVVSGSNAGTAGGSTNLLNLGGLKICWGITALCTALSTNGNAILGVTFPTTYTSPPTASVTGTDYVLDARIIVGGNQSPTTTVFQIEFQSANAGANAQAKAHWIAIGT